jgi:hypothetical protein
MVTRQLKILGTPVGLLFEWGVIIRAGTLSLFGKSRNPSSTVQQAQKHLPLIQSQTLSGITALHEFSLYYATHGNNARAARYVLV